MATQLLDEQFESAVRSVIAERPFHVYQSHGIQERVEGVRPQPSCRYVHDGKPDCVIGQALVRAGIDVLELAILETNAIERDNDSLPAMTFLENFGLSYSTLFWASVIQGHQDKGVAWGEALRLADYARSRRLVTA